MVYPDEAPAQDDERERPGLYRKSSWGLPTGGWSGAGGIDCKNRRCSSSNCCA
jgi:hypothetical protein